MCNKTILCINICKKVPLSRIYILNNSKSPTAFLVENVRFKEMVNMYLYTFLCFDFWRCKTLYSNCNTNYNEFSMYVFVFKLGIPTLRWRIQGIVCKEGMLCG